ncbi:hypothetical protein BKA64DRAFT_650980 [Cadophora sp. MPI-SDFR-AT-0126]|nr:hypothetical protein BKA64DRAFT_650980 [Leotiomycetes sp. MPI-SDFR-AT-0126]
MFSFQIYSDLSLALMSTARSGSTIRDVSDFNPNLRIPHDTGPSLVFNMRFPFRRGQKPVDSSSSASGTASTISTAPSAQQQVPLPHAPAQPKVQPGDLPPVIPPGKKVTPFQIRDLNELIRKRYALDVEIWNKRHCAPRDRKILLEKMRQSDAALVKIMSTVRLWDTRDVWDSNADYHRLKNIRHRLEMEGGKRLWEGNPPWDQ